MIITGYPGIGKSTLAKQYSNVIDLESGCFWKIQYNQKTRPTDWYIYYCQIAEDLSKQGNTVFISCHPEVRKYIALNSSEFFCAIFPDKSLKDDWIKKLHDRYKQTNLQKDLNAYNQVSKNYDADIKQLWLECGYNEEYYNDCEIINTMDYNLMNIIQDIITRNNIGTN